MVTSRPEVLAWQASHVLSHVREWRLTASGIAGGEIELCYCQKSKSRSPSEWKLAATTTTRQEERHRSKVVDKAGGVKHTIARRVVLRCTVSAVRDLLSAVCFGTLQTQISWHNETSERPCTITPCYSQTASVGGPNIDPLLQAMLASEYEVSPASLLSLRPASRSVSRDILRYF
jgi:hypothetical protein